MTIDDEIAVCGVLILANARIHDRRVTERGKPLVDVGSRGRHFFRHDKAVQRVGINERTVLVESDFEAPRFEIRESVHAALVAEIDPDGYLRYAKAAVAGRNAEEEHFLARGKDAIPQDVREYFSEPRAAGENEA